MKKAFFLIVGLFFFSAGSKAQHCPFDYAHIFVLHVTAEKDTAVIPNLKITLKDSMGNVIMTSRWHKDHWVEDTLRLWQNPSKTTHSGVIDNENPMNPWMIRFWFAKNNYVLVDGGGNGKMQLVIEDTDGKKNGGRFDTKVVTYGPEYVFRLCTGISHWDLGPKYGFVKEYKPLEVKLKKLE